MTLRDRWREILKKLFKCPYCDGKGWYDGFDKDGDQTQEQCNCEGHIDHALDLLFDALPVCKTKEEMLECMTEPSDSVDVMLRKAQKISEIIGWNACLAKIKEA